MKVYLKFKICNLFKRFSTVGYMNFFIDKGTMGVNRFNNDTGATNKEINGKCENDF
ncbi:MAG TPA: hypothetical protein VFU29_05525 [Chitinophagaceae bacterium]|nr:hypothetical protein [Chitinophagaceae bacterium]